MGKRKIVVVAENDEDARDLVVGAIRSLGFQVVEAGRGDDLLDLTCELLDDAQDVSLVVSDIGMPGCDGIEAARQLRARAPTLPIVLMTAFADPAVHRRAREAGARELLRKPFSLSALQDAVTAACANKT